MRHKTNTIVIATSRHRFWHNTVIWNPRYWPDVIVAHGYQPYCFRLHRHDMRFHGVIGAMREMLYTWDGISMQGAVIIFLVASSSSAAWTRYRRRVDPVKSSRTANQHRAHRHDAAQARGAVAVGHPPPRIVASRPVKARAAARPTRSSANGGAPDGGTCSNHIAIGGDPHHKTPHRAFRRADRGR